MVNLLRIEGNRCLKNKFFGDEDNGSDLSNISTS